MALHGLDMVGASQNFCVESGLAPAGLDRMGLDLARRQMRAFLAEIGGDR